ncbi:hypothetical protein VCX22_07290 [Aeromonas caviae]|uniref:hypothetical protein n=1 Tax=Aeromonas caviae TaxID=648 RepID=UPI002B25633C|nr:hypothetical protein [Aeromonas caviae]MEA9417315.1 hypothetical protein [Aeromonas caviae]
MHNSRAINDLDLTIVVNTCDLYSDVLELFFAAFKEYWPNCQYPIVINSEKNYYPQYDGVQTHIYKSNNNGSWGGRLLQVLNNIKSEFVLMLYDDFILENMVKINEIEDSILLLKRDVKVAALYLVNTSLPSEKSTYEQFEIVNDYIDFRLNSSPAIWRRSKLITYTGEHDNPWAWEVFGSYRTYGDEALFYTLTHTTTDIYPYNYKKGGAIYRGRWVKDVVENKFKKYQLNIDPQIRGYSEDVADESRSLKWKVNFIWTGYQMVGLKVLLFAVRYIKRKLHA